MAQRHTWSKIVLNEQSFTIPNRVLSQDLPANLLGSFIQGMMETSTSLGLPVDTPIGWDATDSYFQHWDIFHLVIRTGICSSLTTFCSWNSEMVIIIFGTGVSHTSSVTRAFFGYLIGMQTALGSYVLGKKIAVWIHRWRNPLNGKEMDAIMDRKEEGVYINRNLPVFERRYLPNLKMEYMGADLIDLDCLHYLERWRESTANARRVNHPLLELLIEIETALLVDRLSEAPHRASTTARTLNWDVNALELWNKGMALHPREEKKQNDHVLFNPEYTTAILVLLCIVMLVSSLVAFQSAHPFAITYRTIMYATMWAPPGALFRWYLTGFNGALPGNWSWLPAGTMTANVLGSVISIGLIAAEYVTNSNGSWVMASLRAFKVGFIGSLTTVSTFVSEVDGFLKNPRRKDEAYIYMVMSLGFSCLFSVLTYAAVVYH
jgi:fluoride ion exporter CrcB/FEX